MRTFKKQAAQGDLLITRVDSIPADVVKSECKDADYTVAHSETGHNHVIANQDVEFFEVKDNAFAMYLNVKKETELRHLRSFDTHETIKIAPGMYRINRQREYIPEGFRKAQD